MNRIYLASSWRNEHQPRILALLRAAGHEVYDFRNPQQVVDSRHACLDPVLGEQVPDGGFSWSEVDPEWREWSPYGYLAGLRHPRAEQGFRLDFDAMKWADTCVLLLPSGPSAALELGWCAGAGKRTVVHVVDLREPDLMYKVADRFTLTDAELLEVLS